jgi:hypothetical protein
MTGGGFGGEAPAVVSGSEQQNFLVCRSINTVNIINFVFSGRKDCVLLKGRAGETEARNVVLGLRGVVGSNVKGGLAHCQQKGSHVIARKPVTQRKRTGHNVDQENWQ